MMAAPEAMVPHRPNRQRWAGFCRPVAIRSIEHFVSGVKRMLGRGAEGSFGTSRAVVR